MGKTSMARRSFARVAIAVGTGVGVGIATFFGGRRMQSRPRANLEPLMERLNSIEARIQVAVCAPPSEPPIALEVQVREIELLRNSAAETERLAATEIRLSEERFEELTASVPDQINALVAPRVENLRLRLRAEMEESIANRLQTFEQSLDERISARVAAVEQSLVDQSESLNDLRYRAGQTDMNLQKLVEAVERLCERDKAATVHEPAPAWIPEPVRRGRVTLAQAMVAAASIFIGVRFVR
jgi:hypothetical protein